MPRWLKKTAKFIWRNRFGVGAIVYFLVKPHVHGAAEKYLEAGKGALDATKE